MTETVIDEVRARGWFNRLKRVLKDMPEDCELLVSAFGCVTLMEAGSMANNPSAASHGLDLLARDYGIDEYSAKRIHGESSTI